MSAATEGMEKRPLRHTLQTLFSCCTETLNRCRLYPFSHPLLKYFVKMFFINPDKFRSIFNKYDRADLVRCIEKNDQVLEKL